MNIFNEKLRQNLINQAFKKTTEETIPENLKSGDLVTPVENTDWVYEIQSIIEGRARMLLYENDRVNKDVPLILPVSELVRINEVLGNFKRQLDEFNLSQSKKVELG